MEAQCIKSKWTQSKNRFSEFVISIEVHERKTGVKSLIRKWKLMKASGERTFQRIFTRIEWWFSSFRFGWIVFPFCTWNDEQKFSFLVCVCAKFASWHNVSICDNILHYCVYILCHSEFPSSIHRFVFFIAELSRIYNDIFHPFSVLVLIFVIFPILFFLVVPIVLNLRFVFAIRLERVATQTKYKYKYILNYCHPLVAFGERERQWNRNNSLEFCRHINHDITMSMSAAQCENVPPMFRSICHL